MNNSWFLPIPPPLQRQDDLQVSATQSVVHGPASPQSLLELLLIRLHSRPAWSILDPVILIHHHPQVIFIHWMWSAMRMNDLSQCSGPQVKDGKSTCGCRCKFGSSCRIWTWALQHVLPSLTDPVVLGIMPDSISHVNSVLSLWCRLKKGIWLMWIMWA